MKFRLRNSAIATVCRVFLQGGLIFCHQLYTLEIDANTMFYPPSHDSSVMMHLQLLFADCGEDVLKRLLPICRSVMDAFRSILDNIITKRK